METNEMKILKCKWQCLMWKQMKDMCLQVFLMHSFDTPYFLDLYMFWALTRSKCNLFVCLGFNVTFKHLRSYHDGACL